MNGWLVVLVIWVAASLALSPLIGRWIRGRYQWDDQPTREDH